jgi:hypothetical protein
VLGAGVSAPIRLSPRASLASTIDALCVLGAGVSAPIRLSPGASLASTIDALRVLGVGVSAPIRLSPGASLVSTRDAGEHFKWPIWYTYSYDQIRRFRSVSEMAGDP